MVEQLFTARGEAKGNEKKRKEQLFTVRGEKKGSGEAARDRERRQRWRGVGRALSFLSVYVYPCHAIGMRTSGVYEQ
jgi:hypothetical protein